MLLDLQVLTTVNNRVKDTPPTLYRAFVTAENKFLKLTFYNLIKWKKK